MKELRTGSICELKIEFPSNLSEKELLNLPNICLWEKWKQKIQYKLKRAVRIDFDRYIYHHLSKIDQYIGKIIMEEACLFGKIDIVLLMVDHMEKIRKYNIDYNVCLTNACEGGYLNIVKLIITKGNLNLTNGLIAVFNGSSKINNKRRYLIKEPNQFVDYSSVDHSSVDRLEIIKIIKIMMGNFEELQNNTNSTIFSIASSFLTPDTFGNVLFSACASGNKEIIDPIYQNKHYLMGLNGACKGGHLSIVKQIEAKGQITTWNTAFEYACKFNHTDIISYIMQNKSVSWNYGLTGFCCAGNVEMVKFMLEKDGLNLNQALQFACRYGHINIVQLLIDRNADCWNLGLSDAIVGKKNSEHSTDRYIVYGSDHMSIIKLMIRNGADNLNEALCEACRDDDIDLIKYLISKGANNFNWGLCSACFSGNLETVKLMVESGATDILIALNSIKELVSENIISPEIMQYLSSHI